MRKAVVGLLAVALLLVAVPVTAIAGQTGGDRQRAGAAAPAPQGHGDGWQF